MADKAIEAAARALADSEAAVMGQQPYGDTSWACVRANYVRRVTPVIEAYRDALADQPPLHGGITADLPGETP